MLYNWWIRPRMWDMNRYRSRWFLRSCLILSISLRNPFTLIFHWSLSKWPVLLIPERNKICVVDQPWWFPCTRTQPTRFIAYFEINILINLRLWWHFCQPLHTSIDHFVGWKPGRLHRLKLIFWDSSLQTVSICFLLLFRLRILVTVSSLRLPFFIRQRFGFLRLLFVFLNLNIVLNTKKLLFKLLNSLLVLYLAHLLDFLSETQLMREMLDALGHAVDVLLRFFLIFVHVSYLLLLRTVHHS